MVSTFTWVSMVIVGCIAVVVALYMLSAYREVSKGDNKKDTPKNRNF